MKITQELETIRANYDKTIDLVDGLSFSQKRQIKTIEFYSNSRYLNGQQDELGREKPFMQILNAICDVENSAKDIDTKDIVVTSDDPNHYLQSFLLSKDIQVWMKEADFGKTLNDMRDVHTRYGSLLVKKCIEKEENGKKILRLELPQWKNTMTDQVNIMQGAIIEIHWMTAKEVSDKKDSWNKEAINTVLDKLKSYGSSKRVPIYEIRGEFSKATYLDSEGKKYSDSDERKFSYQLYYIAGNPVESGNSQNFTDTLVTLYQEDDTERVYKYLARKPRAGRDFGVGVFEEGEEAQVWTNDAVLKQYRAMEYTSKVIGQSASKKLKGRNLLTETDDGTILEIEQDKPITALQLLPAGGLDQYSMLVQQWYSQLEKTTSAYSAQRGDTPPSGTPFRLQATVLNQSSSVFKILQQEMGIFITEIFEDWIMPHLASKLNKKHILAYDFSPEELKEIDKKFSTYEANKKAADLIFQGKILTQEEYDGFLDVADEFIKGTKGKRFIDVPKDFYKDLDAKVTVNVTGEQKNKAAILESLNSIMITYGNFLKSGIDLSQDPVLTLILSNILELSGAGISPVQITTAINEKQQMQAKQQEQMQQQNGQMPQPQALPLQANPLPQ